RPSGLRLPARAPAANCSTLRLVPARAGPAGVPATGRAGYRVTAGRLAGGRPLGTAAARVLPERARPEPRGRAAGRGREPAVHASRRLRRPLPGADVPAAAVRLPIARGAALRVPGLLRQARGDRRPDRGALPEADLVRQAGRVATIGYLAAR